MQVKENENEGQKKEENEIILKTKKIMKKLSLKNKKVKKKI